MPVCASPAACAGAAGPDELEDGKRGREDPGCEKEQGHVKSGPFDPDVRHGVRLSDRAGRHALRGCGGIERERGGGHGERNSDLDQPVSPPARGGIEAELLRSPVGKFPRRPQPLRDLLLAFSVLRGGGEDLLQIPHDLGLRAAGDMQVLSDLPDILFFHLASSVC